MNGIYKYRFGNCFVEKLGNTVNFPCDFLLAPMYAHLGTNQRLLRTLWYVMLLATTSFLGACNSAVEDLNNVSLDGRILDNLVVFYDFNSGSGLFTDGSELQPTLDLQPSDATAITDIGGGIRISAATELASLDFATKIINHSTDSNAITIEAWVQPANLTQEGPARIVSVSEGAYTRNFTLAQELNQYIVRFNTSDNNDNGSPEFVTSAGTVTTELTHVVFTWNAASQMARFYINGELSNVSDTVFTGDLSSWRSDYRIVIANELTVARPWLGDIHLVAIYNRALSHEEVTRNYDANI